MMVTVLKMLTTFSYKTVVISGAVLQCCEHCRSLRLNKLNKGDGVRTCARKNQNEIRFEKAERPRELCVLHT